MDEIEEGKQAFLELVKSVDAAVQVVIPVTPSNSMYCGLMETRPSSPRVTLTRAAESPALVAVTRHVRPQAFRSIGRSSQV